MKLMGNLLGKGRIVTTDNYFTSPTLGLNLLRNNTYLVGTIRPNRTGVPTKFVQEVIEVGKSLFVFRRSETLLKYQAKKSRSVYLYSTKHHNKQIEHDGKAEIVHFYNKHKGGVDSFNQKRDNYIFAPTTSRWPLVVFHWIIDAASLNAYYLYGSYHRNESRRAFQINLGHQLMRDQMVTYALKTTNWMVKELHKIWSLFEELRTNAAKNAEKKQFYFPEVTPFKKIRQSRCFMCNKLKRNRPSRTNCIRCNRPTCRPHRLQNTLMCLECAAEENLLSLSLSESEASDASSDEDIVNEAVPKRSSRPRCHKCDRSKDRKTSYLCFNCGKPICLEHGTKDQNKHFVCVENCQ